MNKEEEEEELQKLSEDFVHYLKYLKSLYKHNVQDNLPNNLPNIDIPDMELPDMELPNIEQINIDYLCKIKINDDSRYVIIYYFIKIEYIKVTILLKVLNKFHLVMTKLRGKYMDAIKKYQSEFNNIRIKNCIKITCPVMINTVLYYHVVIDKKYKKFIKNKRKIYYELLSTLKTKSEGRSLLSIDNINSLNYENKCDCTTENQVSTNEGESSKQVSTNEEHNQPNEEHNQPIEKHNQPKESLITKSPSRLEKVQNGFASAGATLKGATYALSQVGPAILTIITGTGRGGKKSRKRKHNKLKKKRKSTRKKRRKSNKKHH